MTDKKLTQEQAEKIFDKNPVPSSGIKTAAMPFVFHTEIDTTPQLLRLLRPFYIMHMQMPPALPVMAREVLRRVFRCFGKAGHVSEGLVGDAMWGFAEDTVEEKGLPPEVTWMGLQQLEQLGYIRFQAKDNSYIDPQSHYIGSAWIRYTPKLLEMVYERPEK